MDFEYALKKACEIVAKMTLEEKASQLLQLSPAIERLGIKAYNWWNEAAHGVARAGVATVFPQAIGMAATFHPDLVRQVADAVSTEARAKYNKNVQFEDYDIYKGLTFWAPNINIFRDPRWGRGQETFGEDPCLTAEMGVAYVKGLQGEGKYLKSCACAKHFAVHSGPEYLRHEFDAKVGRKDLWETYLPAFEKAVEAGVMGIMGAYNRTNGEPCCAHRYLMQEVLEKQWGFKGYFVSDCGALTDICDNHHVTDTRKEAGVMALKSGCHLNCGGVYRYLMEAYRDGSITEEEITDAAVRVYTIRALLGEFEEERPYREVSYDYLDCDAHKELNLKTSRESVVLLKNNKDFLPIKDGIYKKIAVVGPNGNSVTVLEGNYEGRASEYTTVADGMRKVFPNTRILVANGSHLYREMQNSTRGFECLWSEGMAAASEAEVTILCLGMDRTVEGEELPELEGDCFFHGERISLSLPKTQIKMAEKVCEVCENVIVVVMCGSAVDLGEKINNHAKAIIHAWYPGAQGGLAIAELLSGAYSPSGKLPVTFYRGNHDLPPVTDYNMEGRTYRYLKEEPLYPFGYGLSYTKIVYDSVKVLSANEKEIVLGISFTNTGEMDTLEKTQVYARYTDTRTTTPHFQLCGLVATECRAGETKYIECKLDRYWIKAVLEDGTRVDPDGEVVLYVGSHQPDEFSTSLTGSECISIRIEK